MKKAIYLYLVLSAQAFAQGHDVWINKIRTIDDAHKYASKHDDVRVGYVNAESDIFLFEHVDQNNLAKHIGETSDMFGRGTKFLKDTLVMMASLQQIYITSGQTNVNGQDLYNRIADQLSQGKGYWEIKELNPSSDLLFKSSPEYVDGIHENFGLDVQNLPVGSVCKVTSKQGVQGFIIIEKAAHLVPAYIAISYNTLLEE